MSRPIHCKNLVSRSHVTLEGSAVIDGQACIGGNLTVEGDLTIKGDLLCMGRINVSGHLNASSDIVCGRGLAVDGLVKANTIEVFHACDDATDFELVAQAIEKYLPPRNLNWDDGEEDAISRLVDRETLLDIVGDVHQWTISASWVECLVIKGGGDIRIVGILDCDIVDAPGSSLKVGRLYAEDDVTCSRLEAEKNAEIGGTLLCDDLTCKTLQLNQSAKVTGALLVCGPDLLPNCEPNGADLPFGDLEPEVVAGLWPGHLTPSLICHDLTAGSIEVRGSLYANGQLQCTEGIQADLSVTATGGITTGADHGVRAGLGVPTNLWGTLGFISTPGTSPKVLSGTFSRLGQHTVEDRQIPVSSKRRR